MGSCECKEDWWDCKNNTKTGKNNTKTVYLFDLPPTFDIKGRDLEAKQLSSPFYHTSAEVVLIEPNPYELTPVVQPFGQNGTIPDYRTVYQGLNFNSKCINPGCIAYNDTIYVTKGLGKFNIADASASLKCPKCGNQAEQPINFGFHSAQWEFEKFTREGRKDAIPSGQTSTWEYYTWKEGNSTIWRFLNVQVNAYQP